MARSQFTERHGLDLKGQYVGQTAATVKEAVADALGGCLFIDEVQTQPPHLDHPRIFLLLFTRVRLRPSFVWLFAPRH